LRCRHRRDPDEQFLAGPGPSARVARFSIRDAWIARLQSSNIDKLTTNLHRSGSRPHVVLENRANVAVFGVERDPSAFFLELAAKQDVLKVEETGELPEPSDRRQSAWRRLCRAEDRRQQDDGGDNGTKEAGCVRAHIQF